MKFYFCAAFMVFNPSGERFRSSDAFKIRHIAKYKCYREQNKCLSKITKIKPVKYHWTKRYSWECKNDIRRSSKN